MAKEVKPIETEHSTEWHWWAFSDFCKLKAEVKEPSPHLQMIGTITEGESLEDKIWFCCLYAAFYNIPSALVMWEKFPWEISESAQSFEPWLSQNWKGLTTRTERRTVRIVGNMDACLESLAHWARTMVPIYLQYPDDDRYYDIIWQRSEEELRYMGRYIIIRLLEALHRFCGLKPKLYDIRSIGGWSPKRALGLLYPQDMELLLSPDTKENVKVVDALAFDCINKLGSWYGIKMSPYVFAAMLCEYRVCYENRHQYPGWTIDQEPAYWYKIKPHWVSADKKLAKRVEDMFFYARKLLFPPECLGELNGWPSGTRVEPRRVLRDFEYNWADTRYDFNATLLSGDWKNPVVR